MQTREQANAFRAATVKERTQRLGGATTRDRKRNAPLSLGITRASSAEPDRTDKGDGTYFLPIHKRYSRAAQFGSGCAGLRGDVR